IILINLNSTLFTYTTLFRSSSSSSSSSSSLPESKTKSANEIDFDKSYDELKLTIEQIKKHTQEINKIKNSNCKIEYIKQSNEYRSEEHTSELQSRFDLVCRL